MLAWRHAGVFTPALEAHHHAFAWMPVHPVRPPRTAHATPAVLLSPRTEDDARRRTRAEFAVFVDLDGFQSGDGAVVLDL